jgi:peptidoglycan-associated lipoprotein
MVKVLAASAAALVFAFAFASCGNKPKGPSCKSDKDCKAPLVCGDNKCVECNDDSQCTHGKKCNAEHACVAKAECTSDDQCPAGKVCQAGQCKACASDGECGPGGSCQAGACQKAKKCTKDDECADDEDCVQGFCQKANKVNPGDVSCALQTVYFAFDQAGIEASERDRLDKNAQCIGKNKSKSVFLIGHTDTSGTEEYNIALSERRAQTVADYLSRLGADPARMQVVPKGETEPTGLGDDKDRRVEFQWH